MIAMEASSSTSKFTNKFKKSLFEKINNLSSTEHEEIYKIITSNSINISKNKNGVFFNLSSVSDEIVNKISIFVEYCLSNKDELDEYDKKLNECKLNNKYSDIMQMNVKLEQLIDTDKKNKPKDDWSKVKLDSKSISKFHTLVDKLNEDRDKLHIKKLNSKFINAKKKYSKKITSDKKFDCENVIELNKEPYIF